MTKRHIVLGISGASGFQYGYKALQLLQDIESMKVHLAVSKGTGMARALETPYTKEEACRMTDIIYPIGNLAVSISSGSFKIVGVLATPHSTHTLTVVTHGYGDNLLTRVANVVLEKHHSLVPMVRETPLNLAYLDNMCRVTEMGGIIFPPVPTLCLRSQSVDDILTHSASRALELLGLDVPNLLYWGQ